MRNPNGYGGISRLPGNRRRPYRARVTVGWVPRECCPDLQKYMTIGYYATRGEAIMALAEYNRDPKDPGLLRTTFRQVYDLWSPEYFEKFPSTRRVTESAMAFCRRVWDTPIRDLRTAQLQEVIVDMGGKSRGYQSKVRSLMHMVFRWAQSRGIIERDWSQFVELTADERATKRAVFTPQEIAILWNTWRMGLAVPGEPERLRSSNLFPSLLLLLYTGLRVGELLELRREDVNLEERYIDLRGTKTKAARRRVPLHREILPVVRFLLNTSRGHIVHDARDRPMTYSQYKYGWFDRVMEAMDMRHTPHDARHTFVSALDSAGVRRGAIMFIVGHSQRDVTDRYTHKDIPELVQEVDKLTFWPTED